mmetsp:Transcript_16977/g.34443  ORF Transcript_16977/g.34443 Transcript_16977/m.34443 type:complete len:104 (+) Transcript_16977:2403-2714(+)
MQGTVEAHTTRTAAVGFGEAESGHVKKSVAVAVDENNAVERGGDAGREGEVSCRDAGTVGGWAVRGDFFRFSGLEEDLLGKGADEIPSLCVVFERAAGLDEGG